MALNDLTDPNAVKAAMAEFDSLGREAFLKTYGYGEARRYVIRSEDGSSYDSKAIAGVAHGYQFPEAGPLAAAEFSGGEATVTTKLYDLGFKIILIASSRVNRSEESNGRNPPWTRDELIIALEFYIRYRGNPPRSIPEINDLSVALNRFQRLLGSQKAETLRNVNGVYMKMMNFRRFDPAFIGNGKSGLSRGNKLEEEVWETFHADPTRLTAVANAIREQLNPGKILTSLDVGLTDDDDLEAPEGKLLTRLHKQRERNRELVRAKKRRALAASGVLKCEVCTFDFSKVYGERGHGFIECHHTKPVETLSEHTSTRLSDLALLCSNCHRMVHARRPWLTLQELHDVIGATAR